MPDSPVPLCTPEQFTASPFGDLVREYEAGALADLMAEATRVCETACAGRRLAPFTGLTETHRASAIDPDEYSDQSNLPMDIQSTLGTSYAQSLGASELVRHCWLDQAAPLYQDLWTYSDVSVTIIRSYGGTQQLTQAQILNGPEPDTGHLWFQLGLFLPVGSRVQVTYSGGYTVAVPGDLVRACRLMAAWSVVSELNPEDSGHDPDRLRKAALSILKSYGAEGEEY